MIHLVALLLAVSAAIVIATGAAGTMAEEREGPAPARTKAVPRGEACLSPADMREAVAEKQVIAPYSAIQAVRQAYPRAEIQRASLCRQDAGLVYVLTTLRRDGQFVQVMVDAQSGQLNK